jgi:cytochrome P450
LPTPSNLRLRQALAIFKKATGQLISERSSQKREARDLLDQLMMARHGDTGEPLSEQHIVDEVLTFLIAGHDTTALTLAYTCALLAENPAALTNLQAELQVLKGAQDFSAKNLSKLPKLNQCLLESMRLLPAVYMINRSNREPFTYKQWTFPRDTTFFVSQYATHRDPEYWPDPLAYKPERFANGEPTDFSFFPFAGGPRTCIGNHLAMIEARGVLARILRHFVPTKLAHPFKVSPYLTSIPEPGISLWWKKRE